MKLLLSFLSSMLFMLEITKLSVTQKIFVTISYIDNKAFCDGQTIPQTAGISYILSKGKETYLN